MISENRNPAHHRHRDDKARRKPIAGPAPREGRGRGKHDRQMVGITQPSRTKPIGHRDRNMQPEQRDQRLLAVSRNASRSLLPIFMVRFP